MIYLGKLVKIINKNSAKSYICLTWVPVLVLNFCWHAQLHSSILSFFSFFFFLAGQEASKLINIFLSATRILSGGFLESRYSKVGRRTLKDWLEMSAYVFGCLKPDHTHGNLGNQKLVMMAEKCNRLHNDTQGHRRTMGLNSILLQSLKAPLATCSQESIVLSDFLIIGLIPWWVFQKKKSFKSCNCTHFLSLASCIHYFPPLGSFPGISRK